MKLHNIYKSLACMTALLSGVMMMTTSCSDYLDVRPSGEKVEGDLFSTSKGFEEAIYGVYGSMASTPLYGMDMLWGLTDIMAQDLGISGFPGSIGAELPIYNYDNESVRERFSALWTNAYQTIGYANNVLYNLDGRTDLLYGDIYRGEMLAVRALLHFDLMRIFASTDKSKTGIPYADTWNFSVKPFLTVGDVCKRIETDLIEAEKLLAANDEKIMTYPHDNNQYDAFMNWRETHMNVWAVRALLARFYWYTGNMAEAASYAESVILSGAFTLADMTEMADYLGGVLSLKETIFGIYAPKYASTCNSYLYTITSYKSYTPYDSSVGSEQFYPWQSVFAEDVEATSQDFRRQQFRTDNSTTKCLKLVDTYAMTNSLVSTRPECISGVTVMHLSEMYLIAADALLDIDYDRALGYFNDEIISRGLTRMATNDTSLSHDRISNEFHKELFGEGQVWFEMKRRGCDIRSNAEKRIVAASDDIYVVPVPAGEYEYRN